MSSSKRLPGIRGLFSKKQPVTSKGTWALVIAAVLFAGIVSSVVVFQLTRNNNEQSSVNNQIVQTVELKKSNDQPIDLLIKSGEYVQFNSADGGEHQIVQGNGHNTTHGEGALDSGVFQGDEGYRLQFNKIGKYEFHDNYDHDYTITVVVYDPNNKDASTVQ